MVPTDLVLTGITGAELARTLHREAPAIPVLFMSSYADNAGVHSGVIDPRTPSLAKPFSKPERLRAVAALLASR